MSGLVRHDPGMIHKAGGVTWIFGTEFGQTDGRTVISQTIAEIYTIWYMVYGIWYMLTGDFRTPVMSRLPACFMLLPPSFSQWEGTSRPADSPSANQAQVHGQVTEAGPMRGLERTAGGLLTLVHRGRIRLVLASNCHLYI